ncbi:two-component system, OmpR family, bacitracin resistance sensor histidine kinase BceS [Paenibacillus sp. CF095]|uniref:sensor histidine kinase n=1 Tax=Paenibacillus sp. CF095 TaxID=1881033 RepID=UPI00088F36B4|nr:sensor histidine kinase [Paenibacillus sp. CF095]SDC93666.1 two-component system, OmpR family, bacitracin resistance sensor histidine kinase BceS [Paenibacillus sp. CF095]
MIGKYIRERASWLWLLVSMQLIILLVAYLDSSIPFQSVVYIVGLNVVVCLVFIWARYLKETRFYKKLSTWDHTYDLRELEIAESPYEQIVHEAVSSQTQRYRKESSHHFIALEQEKDEMLSWIHEVKTPLTALQLMIERLPDDKLQSQMTYEWLRIHQLLDQQLHQKRIPFMHNDLFIEETELEPVLNSEIRALKSWCISKGIGFDMSLMVSRVLTDSKWLGFILRQLLSNAVKYSDSSDILIESREQDGHIILMIQDHGRGIETQDLPRIFDKGFTSTRGRMDGAATGMGLYLVRQVVQTLHMSIHVESSLGEGTTVTLTFPRKNDMVHLAGV